MAHRGIETFLAVARQKTLKAAAVELHLAQSTISKRLQLLEEEYGVVLFDRAKGGKEVILTPNGERFVTIVERMLALTYEAKRMGAERQRLHVSLGAVASMNSIIFPALYSRLLEYEPHLSVAITTLHSDEMYGEIDTRQIDIAFPLLERTYSNVTVRRCFSEPMLGVRLADGSNAGGRIVSIESLDPGLELYFPWTPAYQIWHCECCPSGVTRILVDDPHLLFNLLQRPDQWAIVPLSVARHFHKPGKYDLFRLEPAPPDRVCFQLTHKSPRPHAREAVTLVEKHLNKVLAAEFGPNRDARNMGDFFAEVKP
jgi:DNA-binding transcriptional LysR family regulator